MPNTGGPSRGLLYGGVGLVLAGLATLGLRRSGRHGVR
jgi:LPXTG-motif cell wall-anchored protein